MNSIPLSYPAQTLEASRVEFQSRLVTPLWRRKLLGMSSGPLSYPALAQEASRDEFCPAKSPYPAARDGSLRGPPNIKTRQAEDRPCAVIYEQAPCVCEICF